MKIINTKAYLKIAQFKDDPARWHQLQIAKKTLRMSDMGANIMGGMTKDEAREVCRRAGWSDQKIQQFENKA